MQRELAFFLALIWWLAARPAWPESGKDALSGDLIIYHAGSLAVPLREVCAAFMREHPQIRCLSEAAGSRLCARKISELRQPCDVLLVSDYRVIGELLMPEHATWSIRFAGNEMTLAYTDRAQAANEINATNWPHVLLRSDLRVGRSDPDSDPCGYRTVMALRLAELHYPIPHLADRLLQKDRRYVRPKEVDLLALLETGAIDYAFTYKSVALQHGLRRIELPDEINLGSPAFADAYPKVEVEVRGRSPDTIVKEKGAPIAYGVTIPLRAPNKKAALAFVAFLLSKEKGLAILEQHGQRSLVPSPSDTYEKIPDSLKRFAREER